MHQAICNHHVHLNGATVSQESYYIGHTYHMQPKYRITTIEMCRSEIRCFFFLSFLNFCRVQVLTIIMPNESVQVYIAESIFESFYAI